MGYTVLSAFNLDLCPQMICSAVKDITEVHNIHKKNSVGQIKTQERRENTEIFRESDYFWLERIFHWIQCLDWP